MLSSQQRPAGAAQAAAAAAQAAADAAHRAQRAHITVQNVSEDVPRRATPTPLRDTRCEMNPRDDAPLPSRGRVVFSRQAEVVDQGGARTLVTVTSEGLFPSSTSLLDPFDARVRRRKRAAAKRLQHRTLKSFVKNSNERVRRVREGQALMETLRKERPFTRTPARRKRHGGGE